MEWFKIGCLLMLVIVCLSVGYGIAKLDDAAEVASSPKVEQPAPLGSSYQQDPPPEYDPPPDTSGARAQVQQSFVRTGTGEDLQSITRGPRFTIYWQSRFEPNGARLLDVVEAMRLRLEYLQTTRKGGDQIAKLLWDVTQLKEKIEDIDVLPRPRPSQASGAGFPPPESSP